MREEIKKRAEAIVRGLTLEEKAAFCSGKGLWHLKGLERAGIPDIMVADGPHGLRKQAAPDDRPGVRDSVPATCFPTAVGLAAAWNCELLTAVGRALGEECLQEGVSVLLGPGMNIKRSPLCGRNFEYFSDPYLAGACAAALVRGVQSVGVGTAVKHFAVNNQEKYRMSVNAVVDERALREIYLAGFEKAIKEARPWTVMAAYNKLNGVYATENKELLTGILREEWGFDGLVMSDWGATDDRVRALAAGMDLEMPSSGGINDRLLVEAVRKGVLPEEKLDAAVKRVLSLILTTAAHKREGFRCDMEAHHKLARRAASEGMVLLKNEGGLLPLPAEAKIALIGQFAEKPRYQGAGSSLVNPFRLDTALAAGLARLGGKLSYAPGYDIKNAAAKEKLLAEARETARAAEITVILAGLTDEYESEGFDREHLQLPDSHNRLIESICQVTDKVVVVLFNGAPVLMPWLDRVPAVLEAYLPGQAGGSALWDILLGDINPSGKLPETFPSAENDYPAAHYFPMGPEQVEYRESLYVGYRYYDTAGTEPLFPFGHGLSYTTFVYSGLTLSRDRLREDEELTVTLTVENAGDLAGAEVVQLYVRDPESSVFRPEKELKGFAKVYLLPKEKKVLTFTLDKRAFAYYDVARHQWQVESGEFAILAGASSRDIRLCKHVYVEGTAKAAGQPGSETYRRPGPGWQVAREDFALLLGRNLPPGSTVKPYHRNTPLVLLRRNLIGRLLYFRVMQEVRRQASGNAVQDRMMAATARELPLRAIVTMSGGAITFDQLDGLLDLLNGHYLRGLARLWRSRKKKKL
ncbi:MAG: glycosyl hydrolase [Firmicutes bacterium]|nr:glycosyl hydrolase [Bacillota bacterium]